MTRDEYMARLRSEAPEWRRAVAESGGTISAVARTIGCDRKTAKLALVTLGLWSAFQRAKRQAAREHARFERDAYVQAITECHGNTAKIARRMKLTPAQVGARIRQMRLQRMAARERSFVGDFRWAKALKTAYTAQHAAYVQRLVRQRPQWEAAIWKCGGSVSKIARMMGCAWPTAKTAIATLQLLGTLEAARA